MVGYLSPTYRDAIAFVLLIVILLVRPAILGKRAEKGDAPVLALASSRCLAVLDVALPRVRPESMRS